MSEPTKALVVEDEAFTSMMIEEVLREKGFETVTVVTTGQDPVRLAAEERPDLVIMDYQLSGAMKGMEAAKEIEKLGTAQVVVMSGYSESNLLEKAPGYRPKAILTKPIDEADIAEVLKTLFPARYS